mgnify:FL=1
MKYVLFIIGAVVAVPCMTAFASIGKKYRSVLIIALLIFIAIGVSINFVSMEWYRGPNRGYQVDAVDLITFSLLFALPFVPNRGIRLLPPGSFYLGLYFLFVVISLINAWNLTFALFGVFKLALSGVLFWTTYQWFRKEDHINTLVIGLIFLAVIQAIAALKQKYGDGYYRVPGTFEHSNSLALFINLLLPVAFIASMKSSDRKPLEPVLLFLSAMALLATALFTYSRATIVLGSINAAAMIGYARLRVKSRYSGYISTAFAIFALIGAGMAAPSLVNRFKNAPKSSHEAREEFNIAAKMMADDLPTGVGYNCFSHALTNSQYRDHIKIMKNEQQAGVAHHIYWLNFSELGYWGGATYIILIIGFEVLFFRFSLRGSRDSHLILFGIASGFLTLHLQGLLEWATRTPPLMYQMAFFLGVGSALVSRIRENAKTDENPVIEELKSSIDQGRFEYDEACISSDSALPPPCIPIYASTAGSLNRTTTNE